MTTLPTDQPVTPLRRRMLDDMTMRRMGSRTQHDYIRHVRDFAGFLARSPDTATAEDIRRFLLHQREHGVGEPLHAERGRSSPRFRRCAASLEWLRRDGRPRRTTDRGGDATTTYTQSRLTNAARRHTRHYTTLTDTTRVCLGGVFPAQSLRA